MANLENLPKIIGLAGPIRSGKSTLARILVRNYGYKLASNSEVLVNILLKLGIEVKRNNLRMLGDAIFEELGNEIIARSRVANIGNNRIIVDGIRYLEEVKFYRQYKSFLLIGVSTDFDKRFQRASAAKVENKDLNLTAVSFRENDGARSEIEVPKILELSDYIIENDSSIIDLENKAIEIIDKHLCNI